MTRMRFLAVALAATAFSLSAAAQNLELALFANRTTVNGEGNFTGANVTFDLRPAYEAAYGFGGAVNVFWGRSLSTEVAVSIAEPDVELESSSGIGFLSGGSFQIMPITATVQWHFARGSTIDPYLGAGGAYVLFDDISGFDDRNTGVVAIGLEDQFTYVLNGGLRIGAGRFGVIVDAKYMPVTTDATTLRTIGPEPFIRPVDLNTLVLSAGVRLSL